MPRLKFKDILKEQVLMEISIKDHFERFGSKYQIDYDYYLMITRLDPTSNDAKIKGKYTEWLLDQFQAFSVKKFEEYIENNDIYKWLKGLENVKGFDIYNYSSLRELKEYYESLDEEDLLSNKEKKKRYKDILSDEENIEVIYRDSDWFVGRPITQIGNIKMARYKTSESAEWCTADEKRPEHWRRYKNQGELFTFIPLNFPDDKFHVHVVDNEIVECNDFDNEPYREGREIIEELNGKTDGLIFKKMGIDSSSASPIYLKLDEYGLVSFCFDLEFDHSGYANRPPRDEQDFDDLYENKPVYNITNYSRLLEEGLTRYVDNYPHDEDKLDNFIRIINDEFYSHGSEKKEIESSIEYLIEETFSNVDDDFSNVLDGIVLNVIGTDYDENSELNENQVEEILDEAKNEFYELFYNYSVYFERFVDALDITPKDGWWWLWDETRIEKYIIEKLKFSDFEVESSVLKLYENVSSNWKKLL